MNKLNRIKVIMKVKTSDVMSFCGAPPPPESDQSEIYVDGDLILDAFAEYHATIEQVNSNSS